MLLRRHPIAFVKLGAPFIGELVADRSQRRAVANAVGLAHRCGQRVIAQGVESMATLDLLVDLGADEAQGHALGPPEPLDRLLAAA